MGKVKLFVIAATVLSFLFIGSAIAQEESVPAPDIFQDPERTVTALYEAVTFGPGQEPDWNYVRTFFIDEAVIVLRTSFTSTAVFDVDGFVELFIKDIEKHQMSKTGFFEKVLKTKTTVFGDIAHCFVVYKAGLMPEGSGPGNVGLDSFQLFKRGGRWWIVSVVNEVVTPNRPLPEELKY